MERCETKYLYKNCLLFRRPFIVNCFTHTHNLNLNLRKLLRLEYWLSVFIKRYVDRLVHRSFVLFVTVLYFSRTICGIYMCLEASQHCYLYIMCVARGDYICQFVCKTQNKQSMHFLCKKGNSWFTMTYTITKLLHLVLSCSRLETTRVVLSDSFRLELFPFFQFTIFTAMKWLL